MRYYFFLDETGDQRQIDQMVYDLYGLTPDETEIVEGKNQLDRHIVENQVNWSIGPTAGL